MSTATSKKSNSKNIPFALSKNSIDYFKLEENFFKPDFNVQRQITTLKVGDYFTLSKDAPNFDYAKKETVIFNFQVGQGKTTLCYDLIEEYEKRGYCVIVCSPFIKLVNKDYEEIKVKIEKVRKIGFVKGKPIKVFKYDEVDDLNEWGLRMSEVASQTHSVHVMTINCLLGNSGSSEFEQAFSKKDYLKNLLDATKKKKVVLFIDEIHESIGNFRPDLIPNILKWKGIVEKVFIASATFTPATIPIIKACALLTDKNIQVYETVRTKNTNTANIHLHILNIPYFNSKAFEDIIENEASFYQNKARSINIITGTKAMAERISGIKGIFSTVITKQKNAKPYNAVNVNLLTADNDITYHAGHNNIGTTFKTGVNINDKKSVLFVIFPYLAKNAPLNSYGIFSDGISSIIQSIGRLRNGGDIHLFINEPDSLVGQSQDYPLVFSAKEFVTHLPITNSYSDVLSKYQSLIGQLEIEINEMEKDLSTATGVLSTYKKQFGFWYPNEHEFILTNSQSFALRHDNSSFGKLLSPYVFWSCINDQFINGSLKSITHYGKLVIDLTSNASNIFSSILSQHSAALKNDTFRKAIGRVGKYLSEGIDANGNPEKIEYSLKGKPIKAAEIIGRKPAFLNEIAKLTFNICTNSKFPNTKGEYINACINESQRSTAVTNLALTNTYFELGLLKKEFIVKIKSVVVKLGGKDYMPKQNASFLSIAFVSRATSVIEILKEQDFILKYKAFSFMQDKAVNNERLNNLFEELFLTLGYRKQIQGQQYIEVLDFDPMAGISVSGLL